jgi:hypothetical protein
MQNGPNTMMNTRQPRPARQFPNRTKRWTSGGTSNAPRPEAKDSQSARRNYERYLALAQAEVQAGNTIGAENYYQYAEHYFRSMSSDRDAT